VIAEAVAAQSPIDLVPLDAYGSRPLPGAAYRAVLPAVQKGALVREQPGLLAAVSAADLANKLYYGDNLGWLKSFPPEFVDLVYLDPPWNSKADYNVIFRDESGRKSDAQRHAFADTWHWGPTAEDHYAYLTQTGRHGGAVPAPVGALIATLRASLGANQMMAYIVQMTVRLVPLHRTLKPTGSLYLHSDPTASHYLKIVLDALFGARNFRSEITWKRTNVHSDSKGWSAVADKLLYYVKDARQPFVWNPPRTPYTDEYVAERYRHRDADGRRYMLDNMTSPSPRPNMMYEWKGYASPRAGWRFERTTMERLDAEGRIWYPDSHDKRPRLKRYLDQMPGTLLTNIWADVPPINSQARERMGWGTQKPLALLNRVIGASSQPGDIVLDPFCGCGTALDAAEGLGRRWIGIDVAWYAMAVMKARLRARHGVDAQVEGAPTEVEGARQLSLQVPNGRDQFEAWALTMIGAVPHGGPQKKGADQGADGVITFSDSASTVGSAIVSVKSGHAQAAHVQQLKGAMERHGGSMGLFVTLEEPSGPMRQEAAMAGLYHSPITGKDYPRLQILTVRDLLEKGRKPDIPPLIASPYRETFWSDAEVPAAAKPVRPKRSHGTERVSQGAPAPTEHPLAASLRASLAEDAAASPEGPSALRTSKRGQQVPQPSRVSGDTD
jgi:site-specific DNA-methyltransferase (adenine-specific)